MAKKTSKPAGERPAMHPEFIHELLEHDHRPEDLNRRFSRSPKAERFARSKAGLT